MIKYLLSDYKKYKSYGGNFITIIFFTQGFWAIMQYRIANFVFEKVKLPIVRQVLLFFCLMWRKIIEIATGISIPASVKIGKSFYIGHFGGIILNSKAIIGQNCNIGQGVTIGVSGVDGRRGVPIIGDNVFIGVNSVVAGNIVIGNNVLIGACSLVNSNVENDAVMLGVPAKLVSKNSSKGYI